jgi:Spy/CpxP family protein refolding chaperone
MRYVSRLFLVAVGLGVLSAVCAAQQPKGRPADKAPPKGGQADPAAVDAFVARMMAFDKNKDGKLTRDEITDPRLLRLFDRADANKDGVVTKEELVALATEMAAEQGPDRGGPGGGFGPPPGFGPGGPGGRGRSGPGGPGGFGGPPQPGQILPPFIQERLELTAEQKQQLEDLQKEVDARLGKILTAEQKKQLQEMRQGFGRGGPGGRGPGGPPPGGEGGRPRRSDEKKGPE